MNSKNNEDSDHRKCMYPLLYLLISLHLTFHIPLDANYLICGLSVLFMIAPYFINNYEVTPNCRYHQHVMSTSFKYSSQLVKLKRQKVRTMRLEWRKSNRIY